MSMLFYTKSRYLCPCVDIDAEAQTKLPATLVHRSLHKLPDLYFCPKCHVLKCSHCCDATVVCKYCANCMTDYTESSGKTRCSKNCFECPECESPLSFSIQDDPKGKGTGKQFHFACGHCSYSYATKIVTKPAPLSTILKNEQASYFQELQVKYNLRNRLLRLKESGESKNGLKLTPGILSKMRQMAICPPSSEDLSEIENLNLKLNELKPVSVDIDADFVSKPPKNIPRGNHLSAKLAYSCKSCGTRLASPVPDARSMKYLEKELAMEIIPLVTAKICNDPNPDTSLSLGTDTSCVLNIVNPMLSSMNITVSTLENIPLGISGTNHSISISLPITSYTISPRKEKANVLDSIPSVYLTKSTQASRGELLTRTIRRESSRRDTDVDEPIIESGSNWVSLPFELSFLETDTQANTSEVQEDLSDNDSGSCKKAGDRPLPLRVPFYITVESKLPSQWTQRNKKGLKFGFWVLSDLS
ncbi:hypothetical protein OXX59_001372 [Metschnikowia pulcherrima]